jgi:nitrite reductase/ring-hydroxylating ferredoxin subunit
VAAAESLIALCESWELADGGVGRRFEVDLGGEPVGAFVVRHRGKVLGYLNRCAHVAMELDWVAGQFFDAEGQALICATHGALYDPANGDCIGGPCTGRGALRRLEVLETDGVVYWRPDAAVRPRGAAGSR